MAIDLSRLRALSRGETIAETGVTTVMALQGEVCNAEKARSNARNARNVSKTVRGEKRENGGHEGVTGGVSEALPASTFDPEALQAEADDRNRAAVREGLTDRFCACRKMATVGVGSARPDRGNPEGVARWLCSECFDGGRAN